MKRKIIIALSVFTLIACAGGALLLIEINDGKKSFDELINLHKIEILREHLLLDIRKVQGNIYSLGTNYPTSVEEIQTNMEELSSAIRICYRCHHAPDVRERLDDLYQQINQYGEALSRLLTMQAAPARIAKEREKARVVGDSLVSKVNTMIVLTDRNLHVRREDTLKQIQDSRNLVFFLVAAGPLVFAIVAFTWMKQVTRPVQVLRDAAKTLQAGRLDHRIEGMSDEFADVARAFNDMAQSLQENMRAVWESERRHRLLFESAADAIFILAAEGHEAGRILQANEAAAQMHGYTVEELVKLKVQDLDAPEAAAAAQERIERMLRGDWIKAEMDHRRKDGALFPVEVSAGVFDVGGRKFILAFDRDITERRKAEREMRFAQRIKLAGEMATGIAHEVKNPLAGIKLAMETLAETPRIDGEDRDVLYQVIGQVARIESLLKGILSFARPPKPQMSAVNVNDILHSVADFLQQTLADARSISLVKELDSQCREVLADPQQLQQVFMNLLLNAADAMSGGGVITMRTVCDRTQQNLRVEIEDEGPGIAQDLRETLFEPFVSTKAKGVGLGLAVSKRLVEEHGGIISAENRPGRGARFTVVLPLTAPCAVSEQREAR